MSSLAFAFVRVVRHFISAISCSCLIEGFSGLIPGLHRPCLVRNVPRKSLSKHLLTEAAFCSATLVSLYSINLFQLISQSALVQPGAEKHRLCFKSQPQEDLFTSNSAKLTQLPSFFWPQHSFVKEYLSKRGHEESQVKFGS